MTHLSLLCKIKQGKEHDPCSGTCDCEKHYPCECKCHAQQLSFPEPAEYDMEYYESIMRESRKHRRPL